MASGRSCEEKGVCHQHALISSPQAFAPADSSESAPGAEEEFFLSASQNLICSIKGGLSLVAI